MTIFSAFSEKKQVKKTFEKLSDWGIKISHENEVDKDSCENEIWIEVKMRMGKTQNEISYEPWWWIMRWYDS